MGLIKRGDFWWIDISVKGQRIRQSTGTKDLKMAEDILAKVKVQIVEDTWFERQKFQKAKTTTFRELVEKYMLHHVKSRDNHTIKRLMPVFGNYTLADIETEMISDYRYKRLKKVKPATVYQELSLMRRMFNVARREWKWVNENPVADLSFSVGNKNARDRWLTQEEEARLLECATNPKWLRPLLAVALNTGMRKGEILDLKWKHVNLSRKLLTIVKSKNGEKRSIPLNKILLGTFKGIRMSNISSRVFSISNRSLRVAYEKALHKAGIENFRFHDLRHTFATRLVQNGVDLYKVKELLGHKTVQMTLRYAHHYPESLRSSVEVLDDLSQYRHNPEITRAGLSGHNGKKTSKIIDMREWRNWQTRWT